MLVERVLDRAKQIQCLDTIVVCTSTNGQDRALAEIASKNCVYYYPGNPDDVLQRLLDAAKFFGLDYLINITGENPFFSVEYANRVVNEIQTRKADLTFFDGLPLGCTVYGIKTKALEVVCRVKNEVDTEIWGPLINRPEIFDINKGEVDQHFKRPSLRITNDYPEDYQFLNAIQIHFGREAVPSLSDVLHLLDSKPELLHIHANRVQASLSEDMRNRIDKFFADNRESILKIKSEIYKAYDI
jgi:spore coat polysaccharide biosynthesis protein SpsF